MSLKRESSIRFIVESISNMAFIMTDSEVVKLASVIFEIQDRLSKENEVK